MNTAAHIKHGLALIIVFTGAGCGFTSPATLPHFMAQAVIARPHFKVQVITACGLLNNRGEIVEVDDDGPKNPRSMQPDYHTLRLHLWKNGKVRNLGSPLDEDYCNVSGFNDNDDIIGIACGYGVLPGDITPDAHYMFLWHNGKYTTIGNSGEVHGINNAGVIVGEKDMQSGQYGFVYKKGKHHKALEIKTSCATLNAVNNYGDSVGMTAAGRAILIHSGKNTLLPLPPGEPPELYLYIGPIAINDRGQIVFNSSNSSVLYLYNKREFTTINRLPGSQSIGLTAFNNRGWVVGDCEHVRTDGHQIFRPFLFCNGQMHDLNDLLAPHSGWTLASVAGLNDRGQMSCSGEYKGKHAFCLLTPSI